MFETSAIKVKRLLYEKGKNAVEHNTKKFSDDFDDLAEEIGDTFDTLFGLIGKEPAIPDRALMAATINWGVLNTLIAAIELQRLGYFKEPMMLVRNAVEAASVAYAISADEETYKKFQADPQKFDSPKAIGKAKEAVDAVGFTYGILSEYFTHTGSLHVMPHAVIGNQLHIGGHLHAEEESVRARLSVLMLKQSVSSLCMLMQTPFPWNDGGSRYWERQADGVTFTGHPATEKMKDELDEMGELIKKL